MVYRAFLNPNKPCYLMLLFLNHLTLFNEYLMMNIQYISVFMRMYAFLMSMNMGVSANNFFFINMIIMSIIVTLTMLMINTI